MYSPPHGALPALTVIKYPSRVWSAEQTDGILVGGSTILGILSSEQVIRCKSYISHDNTSIQCSRSY